MDYKNQDVISIKILIGNVVTSHLTFCLIFRDRFKLCLSACWSRDYEVLNYESTTDTLACDKL